MYKRPGCYDLPTNEKFLIVLECSRKVLNVSRMSTVKIQANIKANIIYSQVGYTNILF